MMCFNKKVIGGLAVVAVGILVLAPGVAGAALPLLVFAACPLSMVFMMKGMQGNSKAKTSTDETPAAARQIDAHKTGAMSSDGELQELRDELARLRSELRERNDTHA